MTQPTTSPVVYPEEQARLSRIYDLLGVAQCILRDAQDIASDLAEEVRDSDEPDEARRAVERAVETVERAIDSLVCDVDDACNGLWEELNEEAGVRLHGSANQIRPAALTRLLASCASLVPGSDASMIQRAQEVYLG